MAFPTIYRANISLIKSQTLSLIFSYNPSMFSLPLSLCLDLVEQVWPWVLWSRSRFLISGGQPLIVKVNQTQEGNRSLLLLTYQFNNQMHLDQSPSPPPFFFLLTAPTRPSICCLRSVMFNKSSYWCKSVHRSGSIGARLYPYGSSCVLWLTFEWSFKLPFSACMCMNKIIACVLQTSTCCPCSHRTRNSGCGW